VNQVLAGPVLAASSDSMSAGTAGLITVVLLVVASGVIFYLMSGSLRRLRGHVQEGDFAEANVRRLAAKAARSTKPEPARPVIPAQPTGTDTNA
jgi:hypothetical protein